MHTAIKVLGAALGVALGGVSSAFGAVPTLSSPVNGAELATLKGTSTEQGSHKWYFYGLTPTDRNNFMNNKEYFGSYAQNASKYDTLRAKMGNTYGDRPKATTFSWSGTGPFTLTIKRKDGTTFLEKTGITGTSLSVDNFEIAASYTWTVSNADGASAPRSFTTEDTVPRLLNGARPDMVCTVKGNNGTSVQTLYPHGVRDMGGYIGMDGRRGRQGLLLRNSAFESDYDEDGGKTPYVNESNIGFWKDFIGIKYEIDLRDDSESQLTKSTLGTGVSYIRVGSIPAGKNLIESNVSGFRSGVKKVFQVLVAPSNYPITFHCTHGKDRTGLVGFLIGCVLGYSVDDIYMDYAATAFWQPQQSMGLDGGNGIVDYLNAHYTDATLQAKAVHLITDSGITEKQLNTMREFLLEPLPTDDVPEQSATFTVNGYKGASTLTGYPVLVRLSKATLANGASATFTEDGADLRAWDADGNEIPHEIETWDPSGESAVWVRLPKLYGAVFGQKTTFKLTWGGEPAARTTTDRQVWSGDYGIVLHGGLDANGKVVDAVTGGAEISVGGTHSEVASGTKVGRALTFDNTSNKATIPAASFVSSGATWLPQTVSGSVKWPFTVSGWFNLSSYTANSSTLLRIPIPSSKNTLSVVLKNATTLTFKGYSGTNDGTSYSVDYPLGTAVNSGWVHLAIVFYNDGDDVRICVNGKALTARSTYDISDNASGQPLYFAEKMNGQLDEFRVMKSSQQLDRLLADYETVADAEFCAGVWGTPSATVTAPTITAPANGEEVSVHTPEMLEFLGFSAATRDAKFVDSDYRHGAAYPEPYNSHPALTLLEWTGSSPSWDVRVYDVTDPKNETELKLVANTVTANHLALGHLMVGRSYRWTVTNTDGQSAEGTFSTPAAAPRAIYTGGKIANCRDMGGWTGLDGRKIRQGRAYRSSGFDDGASQKTSLVDEDSRKILVDTLGIKTDIDTRGKTSGASPLGAGIKVVSQSLESYGGWDDTGYPERFVTVFKTYLDPANYPIVLHCQDGQDRTGCAQFILGGLLGMSDEDLKLDYMWSLFWKSGFGMYAGASKLNLLLEIIDTYSGATYAEKSYSWATAHGIKPDEIETFRNLMLEPVEEPAHEHVWAEASRTEPTCVAAGSVTSNCTGTGTCDLGGTQVYQLDPLGHDFGAWRTTVEPQVGVAGEERRDCQRAGCDACETRKLDPLPVPTPVPTERTVTAGEVKDGKTTLTFGAGTSDLLLFAVWGATDVGDAFHLNAGGENGWDGFAFVARIPATTTSYEYTLPAGWGTTVKYVRFFMTAVDEAPVASLESVGGTGGAAVLDTGYVPTTSTPTIAAYFKTPAGTKSQKIFEVGTEGANDPYLVCDMYVDANGKPAFNCRNSSKTSGWGCNDNVGTAALVTSEVMRWQVACGTPQGRYDSTKDNGAATDVPTAPANGTVKFYGVGEITQATVADPTYVRYLKPSLVYDAAGELVAGFYDSITHKAFASVTATPFTAGTETGYSRDLLNGVTYYGDSGTIEYVAPAPVVHTHVWAEASRTEPTCVAAGSVTSNCTGTGTCDLGGTKVYQLDPLGHDLGAWRTTVEPQVGVAGEKRRDCQREGCDYCVTEVIPALDPVDPTVPDLEGKGWGYVLTGLGNDGKDVALVFTNTAPAEAMNLNLPSGVNKIWYLVVGGGGSGGAAAAASNVSGGGGGAGGYLENKNLSIGSTSIKVSVGAGGVSVQTANSTRINGKNGTGSSLTVGDATPIVAHGGGGGAGSGAAGKGGSGGGGGGLSATTAAAGVCYEGEGFSGGSTATGCGAAGGGGAGGPGVSITSGTVGGAGGPGLTSDICGVMSWYAAGGGGGGTKGNGGTGGEGGGGAGNKYSSSAATVSGSGTTYGSGGGGTQGDQWKSHTSGAGYQGVVIVRYTASDAPTPTPGTITPMENPAWGYLVNGLGEAENETAYVFTNTTAAMSWKTPADVTSVRLLVVGGGGSGGAGSMQSAYGLVGGGGGGAGGYLEQAACAVAAGQTYSVAVGAGGQDGVNGGDSTFGALVAKGGGAGGKLSVGRDGGSGGGGSGGPVSGNKVDTSNAGGKAIDSSLGSAGGRGIGYCHNEMIEYGGAGGGGGAGGAGGDSPNNDCGGNGGAGKTCAITGEDVVYAAGGGGASDGASRAAGLGGVGAGDGGAGAVGGDATGYGCGGGGSAPQDVAGGKGFQGIVVVRCAASATPEEHDYDTLYKTLQTDGKGYILTDYVPANLKTVKVEIKARKLNTLVGFYYMANGHTAELTGKTAASGNELGLGFWPSAQFADGQAPGLQYYCEPGNVIFKRGFADTVWAHTFDAQGQTITMDGEPFLTGKTPKNESAGGPLALFCTAMDGRETIHMAMLRVQYVRVWEGDTLVRDWVPATKNGVATLYDKVRDKCETVLGGTFTADNDIDPDYADKPSNSWTREPSMPTSYAAGTAPTFDIGEARYGSPVATYTAAQLAMLDGGVYTQVVSVAETDEYRELTESVVFTVTGMLPREASVAPAIVWPNGETVYTHTELQRGYLAMSDAERRSAYADAEYRQTLANGKSGPLPTALTWTGDGLTTITVTRVTGTEKQFLRREIVSVKGARNVLEIENLEIATTYRWTVENALGTATGTFTTDAEAPRLLRDPGPELIRGIRDLGGRTGLDGRRVRQGLVFRSSQLGRDTDAVNFVNDVNRSFWADFLGIRTELDFRGGTENAGVTKSPIGDGVNYYKWEEPTSSYGFDSYASYRKSFALFLNRNNYPIDFHCAAGQDRTGVFAFLLNALLGVSEDELQKDWEVTAFWNSSVGFRFANYDEFRANLAAAGGANAREQAENYVINKLKFTMNDINTFRDIMLEEVAPTPSKPTVDGKEVEPDKVFDTATSTKPIVYPAGSTVTLSGEVGAQKIAYGGKSVDVPRYYTATLSGQVVSLALNDNAKPVFRNEAGEEEKSGIVVAGDGTVSLHIANVEPKLWYTLVASSSLDTPVADWTTVAGPTKGACDFTDPAKGDARFYRVVVTDGE